MREHTALWQPLWLEFFPLFLGAKCSQKALKKFVTSASLWVVEDQYLRSPLHTFRHFAKHPFANLQMKIDVFSEWIKEQWKCVIAERGKMSALLRCKFLPIWIRKPYKEKLLVLQVHLRVQPPPISLLPNVSVSFTSATNDETSRVHGDAEGFHKQP